MSFRYGSIIRSLFALAGVLIASASFAENGPRGPVHLEPPKNDPSYFLMGEFAGPVTAAEGKTETIGLQIRPLGKGQFEAISYVGGLPGQENHKAEPTRMIGRLSDDFLVLSGGPWAVFAERDHCTLISRSGDKIGKLDRVVRRSPTLAAKAPEGAVVLFDGSGVDQFVNGQMTEDGLLIEGTDFKPMHQDFDLHLEFRLPYMPEARDQGRGNSGVYIQSRYECQILDSFGETPVFNGAGSLYRYRAPKVNMALPPLVWQTYDIRFTAPRWAADGTKIRNARITAWLNGVIVQDDVELENKTGAGQEETPTLLPTKLQNHSDPVRFRNIWIIDRGLAPSAKFPVEGDGQLAPPAKKPEPKKPEPAEAKPAEAKPAEAKPADTKPADTKPAEAKPADVKPAEAKPADAKPADAKPAEAKPADAKPADAKPADAKPADAKPADAKPADAT
jgi:hypothetical protein